jgi:hypothetical protein
MLSVLRVCGYGSTPKLSSGIESQQSSKKKLFVLGTQSSSLHATIVTKQYRRSNQQGHRTTLQL